MSLDAVKRVMEVEKQASQQREEGEREARRRITAAEKAGAERLESACRAAEIKVKKMMTEEEEDVYKRQGLWYALCLEGDGRMRGILETVAVAFSMFSALPMPQISWEKRNMR